MLGLPVDTSEQGLSGSLARVFLQGRGEWPALVVEPATFAAYVSERFASRELFDEKVARGDCPAGDLYLACACASGNPRALAAFDQRFRDQIPRFLTRFGGSAVFADDVFQLVREKLFLSRPPRPLGIRAYSGQGSLAAWLRVIVVRAAIKLHANQRGPSVDPHCDDLASQLPDPESSYIRRCYPAEYGAALRTSLATLSARQRNLLRYYFVDGLTLDKIGAMNGVNRSTILRQIVATKEQIRAEVHAILRRKLQLSGPELDSLMRVMQSQIEISTLALR